MCLDQNRSLEQILKNNFKHYNRKQTMFEHVKKSSQSVGAMTNDQNRLIINSKFLKESNDYNKHIINNRTIH